MAEFKKYETDEMEDSWLANAIAFWEAQVKTSFERYEFSRNTLPQLYKERKKRDAQPKAFFEGV